jgi:hypothetical protein
MAAVPAMAARVVDPAARGCAGRGHGAPCTETERKDCHEQDWTRTSHVSGIGWSAP